MTHDDSDAEDGPLGDEGLLNISRRGFLGGAGAFAVGLFFFGDEAFADVSVVDGLTDFEESDIKPRLFVTIQPDGAVKVVCHRSEMGQQVWTALAQVMVEELEAKWEDVEIVQAEGHPRYGDQNTDGSRSIRYNFTRFRVMGAAIRTILEQAAARQWDVDASECRAKAGEITHGPSGRTVSFGDVVETAKDIAVPSTDSLQLQDREDWDFIGEPVKSLITPSIIKGEGVYAQDLQVDGMKVAVIARPPQVLGRPKTVDDSAAMEIPGVEKTVTLPDIDEPVAFKPLGGVAVIAENTWAAMQGRDALEIEWEAGPNADYNSDAFRETLIETARESGDVRRKRGDVGQAMSEADRTVEAEYYVPHLAHTAMEPPAALAEWDDDGKVVCWGCIQAPQAARNLVADYCEVPKDDVTIQITWLGGGFGRKSKPDFFGEAAWLAREVEAPVKVVWSREDSVRHSYYHTVSAQRMEGAIDKDGACTAFLHRTVFPPITSTFDASATSPTWGDLRQGATDTPFDVPNLQVESGEAEAHVRTGWLRSVANIYHAFAVQSFVGELAAEAERDQKDFLLDLIGSPRKFDPREEGAQYDNYGSPMDKYPIDTGRMATTVEMAADMADWDRELDDSHGLGIAVHRSFCSYVATAIEVAVDDDGALTIPGVWSVIDAGTVVNPNHVKHQLEGGTIFGLTCAMHGEITATDGAIDQANFPDFRLMRMDEAPRQMEARIVESEAPPGGVGEPPTPPAAPALTNAIYDATGIRIRSLPVFDDSWEDRLPIDDTQGESR